MPDFSGPIQALEWASWLWLVPAFPLLGALINAIYCSGLWAKMLEGLRRGFQEEDAAKSKPSPRFVAKAAIATRIAITSLALSALASAVYCGALLQQSADDRFFFCHLWQLVRVGQLDAGFDLALDPLSSALALVVTVLATLIAMHVSASGDTGSEGAEWRFFAWFGAFVASMLVLLLADDFILFLFGWGGIAIAGYGLVGFAVPSAEAGVAASRAFFAQRVGDVGVVLGVVLLFWGLGGAWTRDGSYQSDLDPRISAVNVTSTDAPLLSTDPSVRGSAATQGKGFLTVTALPGALVYADDSRTPLLGEDGLPLRTPFRRHELAGGSHSFRVAPDDGFRKLEGERKLAFQVEGGVLLNYTVQRIAFGGGREVALAIIGPTLRFRELRDELVISDEKGAHPVRDVLLAKKVCGDLGVVTLACLLIFLGAALKSGLVPFHAWTRPALGEPLALRALIQASGMAIAGVYLVARLAFLFSLSHVASIVVAAVGVLAALYGAFAAAFQHDLKRVLAFSTTSQVGLAFTALGAGAYSAAVFQVGIHALMKTCLVLAAASVVQAMAALERDASGTQDLRKMGGLRTVMPRTATAYRVACIALTAVPIPLFAGFWPWSQVMTQSLATTLLPAALAKGIYAILVAAAGLTSFGMWRSYYLVFEARAEGGRALGKVRDVSSSGGRVLRLLTVLSVATGLALGVGGQFVGGAGDSPIGYWLAPVFSTITHPVGADSPIVRYGFIGLGLTVAYAGWAFARYRYGVARPDDWEAREASLPGHALGARTR